MLNDFFNLIFPRICAGCSNPLLKSEALICLHCKLTLPKTNYHLDETNPLNAIFWGRVQIEMIASMYLYSKESRVQSLLHELKYKGNEALGKELGVLYGQELKESNLYKQVAVIVPVPLHNSKLKQRGYNQSESFAEGLSKTLNIPIDTVGLYRKVASNTQTNKTRYNRWQNVGEIFELRPDHQLSGKCILLVDDVITTGATVEACAVKLLEQNCTVLVATIACA